MNLNILSFNVNSIRANIRKGFWENMLNLNPDIICMQELKCQDDVMIELFGEQGKGLNSQQADTMLRQEDVLFTENQDNEQAGLDLTENFATEFVPYWHTCRMKKGYSGVGILVRKGLMEKELKILEVVDNFGQEKFDQEGRTIALKLQYNDKKFVLFNGYYPQGGREGRVKYKIEFYTMVHSKLQDWQKDGFDLILTGDFNTTIGDIDLARPKENKKTTGCLPEERVALNWFVGDKFFDEQKLQIINPEFDWVSQSKLKSLNLIDTFRHFYPEMSGKYSYWDQISRARDRNVGWRIDMFLVSQNLLANLKSAEIHDQIMGSDHCPISINLGF